MRQWAQTQQPLSSGQEAGAGARCRQSFPFSGRCQKSEHETLWMFQRMLVPRKLFSCGLIPRPYLGSLPTMGWSVFIFIRGKKPNCTKILITEIKWLTFPHENRKSKQTPKRMFTRKEDTDPGMKDIAREEKNHGANRRSSGKSDSMSAEWLRHGKRLLNRLKSLKTKAQPF